MRTVLGILATCLLAATLAWAQTPGSAPATAPGDVDVNESDPLARHMRIIRNVEDSEATRISQAQELLATGLPVATEMIVQTLAFHNESSTKVVLCKAIAATGRRHPELLDHDLVSALLPLLSSPSDAVAISAAEALSFFPDTDVILSLSTMVANRDLPLRQRQAALEALTPNTDRRLVVGELVQLLSVAEAPIPDRILAVLRQISATDFGRDVEKWADWWRIESERNQVDWLRSQARHHARRVNRLTADLEQFRADSEKSYNALSARLTEALSAVYRLTPATEREALLIEWLVESNVQHRAVAVELVAEQISEGNLPSDGLRGALRERFNDESAHVRQVAIQIIAALNDPADAATMLARLGVEQNEQVRATILRVLGKLRNSEAIGPLTAELNRADASALCVAAAADALSALTSREPLSPETAATLVEPLRARFAAKDAPREVKRAVLGAMAAIGSQQFRSVFETNLTSEDPELLLQAIQGAAALGDTEQLDRLVALFGHADARVRQRALESVGRMGTASQLAAVAARLDKTIEPTDGPRNAAWQAFNQITGRMPLSARVPAADRLSKHPALQAEFLQRVEAEMSQGSGDQNELFAVRERIAMLYDSLDRGCEALPYWRRCHQRAVEQQSADVARFLQATLADALPCGKVDMVMELLRSLPEDDGELRADAEATVMAYFDRIRDVNQPAHVEVLADKVRDLPDSAFPRLKTFLAEYYKNRTASRPASQPAHSN